MTSSLSAYATEHLIDGFVRIDAEDAEDAWTNVGSEDDDIEDVSKSWSRIRARKSQKADQKPSSTMKESSKPAKQSEPINATRPSTSQHAPEALSTQAVATMQPIPSIVEPENTDWPSPPKSPGGLWSKDRLLRGESITKQQSNTSLSPLMYPSPKYLRPPAGDILTMKTLPIRPGPLQFQLPEAQSNAAKALHDDDQAHIRAMAQRREKAQRRWEQAREKQRRAEQQERESREAAAVRERDVAENHKRRAEMLEARSQRAEARWKREAELQEKERAAAEVEEEEYRRMFAAQEKSLAEFLERGRAVGREKKRQRVAAEADFPVGAGVRLPGTF